MSGTRVVLEAPGKFDYGAADLRAEWKRWKRGFNSWLIGAEQDGKKEAVKLNLLLTLLGSDGQDIFETFQFAEEQPKLTQVLEQYDSHFAGLSNVTMARFRFFSFGQGSKSVTDFVTGLKSLANDCEFGDLKDSLVKDMIVINCSSEKLRERLLKEPKLNLVKAVEIARIDEEAERNVNAIGRGVDGGSAGAMVVGRREGYPPVGQKSFRRSRNFDGECFECGEYGHMAAYCPKRGDNGDKRPHGRGTLNSDTTVDHRKSRAGYAASFALSATMTHDGRVGWYVDSGASNHMTPGRDGFEWYERYRRPRKVTLGDGKVVRAYGQGEMKLRVRAAGGVAVVSMKNVQFVPKLQMGLLSVPATTRLGNEVSFQRQACVVTCGSLRLRCPVNNAGLYELPTLGEHGDHPKGPDSVTGCATSGGVIIKSAHHLNGDGNGQISAGGRHPMAGSRVSSPSGRGLRGSKDFQDPHWLAGGNPRCQDHHRDLWIKAGGQGDPGASTRIRTPYQFGRNAYRLIGRYLISGRSLSAVDICVISCVK